MRPYERRRAPEGRSEPGLFAEEPATPPWDDPVTRAEFARSRRQTGRRLIRWWVAAAVWFALAVGTKDWMGSSAAYWMVNVGLFIGFVWGIVRGTIAHATCPFCGSPFDLDAYEAGADVTLSGSWNHCASCKVRIR